MKYAIQIKRQAQNKLKSLSRPDQLRIVDAIDELGLNPDNPALDIKILKGTGFYRMRVGVWRVIYSRLDILKIIAIERIGARGDVYK